MADATEPTTAVSLPGTIGSPLPTHSYGPGGSFSITCAARIAASPDACLDVTVTPSGYPLWNRFIRRCTIDGPTPKQDNTTTTTTTTTDDDDTKLRLHTPFTFYVHLNPSAPKGAKPDTTSALQVSLLERIDDDLPQPAGFPAPSSSPYLAEPRRRKGWRIAWRPRPSFLLPAWMLHSERVQEFVEVEIEGRLATQYYCWETFYGVLAPVVRRVVGKQIENGFDAWMEGLRGLLEKGEAGAGEDEEQGREKGKGAEVVETNATVGA